MSFFEKQLEGGIFQICNCDNCDLTLWPPKEICHKCNGKTSWHESSKTGIIIEFSKKDSKFFGLVEIDKGIRILGEIVSSKTPKIGQQVGMNVSFENRPSYSFIVKNN